MNISASTVKELREKTGAGIMDCKAALKESEGDFEKAIDILRVKGAAAAQKRSGRMAKEGLVSSYIHPGGRVGVLVEVNCETDFVARTEEFQALVKDLCMQIAAADPRFVSREQVTKEMLDREKAIYHEQAKASGKPAQVIEKIVAGKMEKFYSESCLLEQAFIKDAGKTVGDLVSEASAKTGENVSVGRFVRYKLGESQESAESESA